METKTKVTFNKEEISCLLSVIDLYEFQDWMDATATEDDIRVMNKFICKLRETNKIQLLIKNEE